LRRKEKATWFPQAIVAVTVVIKEFFLSSASGRCDREWCRKRWGASHVSVRFSLDR
jgi:hypothetical protein